MLIRLLNVNTVSILGSVSDVSEVDAKSDVAYTSEMSAALLMSTLYKH
jgi:hypothetical protein